MLSKRLETLRASPRQGKTFRNQPKPPSYDGTLWTGLTAIMDDTPGFRPVLSESDMRLIRDNSFRWNGIGTLDGHARCARDKAIREPKRALEGLMPLRSPFSSLFLSRVSPSISTCIPRGLSSARSWPCLSSLAFGHGVGCFPRRSMQYVARSFPSCSLSAAWRSRSFFRPGSVPDGIYHFRTTYAYSNILNLPRCRPHACERCGVDPR